MKIIPKPISGLATLDTSPATPAIEKPLDQITAPSTRPTVACGKASLASAFSSATPFACTDAAADAVNQALKGLARGTLSPAEAARTLAAHDHIADALAFFADAIRDDLDTDARARFDAAVASL